MCYHYKKQILTTFFCIKIQDGHTQIGHMRILNIPTFRFGQAKPVSERIFQIGHLVKILWKWAKCATPCLPIGLQTQAWIGLNIG